jgi:hypothetical protein
MMQDQSHGKNTMSFILVRALRGVLATNADTLDEVQCNTPGVTVEATIPL